MLSSKKTIWEVLKTSKKSRIKKVASQEKDEESDEGEE